MKKITTPKYKILFFKKYPNMTLLATLKVAERSEDEKKPHNTGEVQNVSPGHQNVITSTHAKKKTTKMKYKETKSGT